MPPNLQGAVTEAVGKLDAARPRLIENAIATVKGQTLAFAPTGPFAQALRGPTPVRSLFNTAYASVSGILRRAPEDAVAADAKGHQVFGVTTATQHNTPGVQLEGDPRAYARFAGMHRRFG